MKCGFVFAPDGTQILDSYRIEISYDPKALEFSSGKILSDRFNGSFEMIEDDGLLSVIYLAEESDVMREETDMALLRFRTREPDFSGTTALALTNKLTGETESWSLEFASGAVAGEAVKTTASKPPAERVHPKQAPRGLGQNRRRRRKRKALPPLF